MGGKVSRKTRQGRRPVNFDDGRYDYLYKLLLVGDSDTGKTSLMTGFAGRGFFTTYIPTIGVDFSVRTIVLDGIKIKLQIWDTSGASRFDTIRRSFYRGARGVLVVYDATKEKTFDNVPHMLEEVKKYARPEAMVMLVGSKCDLTEEKVVDFRTAKDFADERGIMLMEVSAKDGTNVELAFVTLVAKGLDFIQQQVQGLELNSTVEHL